MLEAVDGELRLLKVLKALEVIGRVPVCILAVVEGEVCLLEMLKALEVLLCMSDVVGGWALFAGGTGGTGDAGNVGGDVLFACEG